MSTYSEASWLRRLWSLARPGDPTTPYVQNVNLVSDMRYRSSREHAPWGRIVGSGAAPAAGEFAGWELRADDPLVNPVVMLHHLRAFGGAAVSIIASVQLPTAALIADRTAAAFSFRDNDADLSLTVNQLSTAGGDLPGTPMVLVPDGSGIAGWMGIMPWGPSVPFAGYWQGGESLFVWAFAADTVVQIDAAIQGMRA